MMEFNTLSRKVKGAVLATKYIYQVSTVNTNYWLYGRSYFISYNPSMDSIYWCIQLLSTLTQQLQRNMHIYMNIDMYCLSGG